VSELTLKLESDPLRVGLLDRALAAAPGMLAGDGPFAVIDIGSNSVRLVVYERQIRAPTVLFNEKILAGLGKGIGKTGRLNDASVEAALAAARRFRQLADQCCVKELHVLATAASREAVNGPDFITAMERICRVPVQVLSGAEEARMAALGVIAGIHDPDGLVGDLGGGSLELVEVRGTRIGEGRTYGLGGIRLSEQAEGSLKKAERIAADILEKSDRLPAVGGRSFYAVGGTWRSLARLHMFQTGYPLHVMQNYAIAAQDALDFCRSVSRGDIDSVDRIEVVSRPRRELLGFGAVVLGQIIRIGKPKDVVMSALGLREGHLYDLLPPAERSRDPLIAAAEELAVLRSREPGHARELIPWTKAVLDALGFDETDEDVRLRIAVCLLADIGWRTHPDYRGEQSLNIIANGAFVGVDHPGRAFMALTIFYRHMGLIDDALSPRLRELAPIRLRERARVIGAAFRVAFILSAGTINILPSTRFVLKGDALALQLAPAIANLDGDVLRRRLKQLARLAGVDATVEIAA
jgi:exopolyphosphatase/guanosine-5'-triphosphate,3'-diphosphate pyrophosphatase